MKLIKAIYQYDNKEELENHQLEMEKQNYRWIGMKSKLSYDGKLIFEVDYVSEYSVYQKGVN